MSVSYITLYITQATAATRTMQLDKIDLKIISSLSRDCRIPYRYIASSIGISANAVKTRVNKMLAKGVIQNFIILVNPAIFGYEKQGSLTVRQIGKTIKEDNIVNKLNLLGDVRFYAKQLGRAALFLLLIRQEAEDKIELMTDLLKPEVVEYRFMPLRRLSINVTISDLKIINCLLSNARLQVADIAKQASISSRAVTRRLEKMRKNRVVGFTTLRDMSSMQLVGYIEFVLLITSTNRSVHRHIVERIYLEMQEYVISIPNVGQSDMIFAAFFCANIPTVDLIVTTIESYDGVNHVELFITTKVVFYQEWLRREINKRLKSEVKGRRIITTRKY
jgi:DNA-binding Lrp family transcriptional regulator